MKCYLKIKVIILLMLVSTLLPAGTLAAGSSLVVELKNGKQTYFILSEKPVLTSFGSQMRIESKSVEISYERSDVLRMYFADESVGVDDIETDKNNVVFTQIGSNRLRISNLSEKDRIIVSNMAGRLYNDCVSRNDSDAIVDLDGCPKGVYIINIGNKQTIKMTKK